MTEYQIPVETVESVCEKSRDLLAGTREVAGANTLQLVAGIAKAIEARRPCQILFVPQYERPGLTLLFTREMSFRYRDAPEEEKKRAAHATKADEKTSLVHTILFSPASPRTDWRELQRERWQIAHELGHIWLHWTAKNQPVAKRDWMKFKEYWAYGACYTEQHEQEADAFATLLLAHSPTGDFPRTRGADERYGEMLEAVRDFLQWPKWNKRDYELCCQGSTRNE